MLPSNEFSVRSRKAHKLDWGWKSFLRWAIIFIATNIPSCLALCLYMFFASNYTLCSLESCVAQPTIEPAAEREFCGDFSWDFWDFSDASAHFLFPNGFYNFPWNLLQSQISWMNFLTIMRMMVQWVMNIFWLKHALFTDLKLQWIIGRD